MSAMIPLRTGGTKRELGRVVAWAKVDEADYPRLAGFRWQIHKDGYAARTTSGAGGVRRHTVLLHREVLGLKAGDKRQGDHINGDRLDCRRANLRIADPLINGQNKRPFVGSSSRYRGVAWSRQNKKWVAYVSRNGQRVHLGYYTDEDEAGRVSAQARIRFMPGAVERLEVP